MIEPLENDRCARCPAKATHLAWYALVTAHVAERLCGPCSRRLQRKHGRRKVRISEIAEEFVS